MTITDRAAQLSGFSLMMMARQDDRRIFSRDVRLNVLSLQETGYLDLPKLWQDLNLSGEFASGQIQDMFGSELDLSSFEADNRYQLLQRNIERFKQAKTFGSLIEVPAAEYEALKELHDTILGLLESGDSIQRAAASQIIDVVHQALLLSIRYDAVVANPPYMGSKGMNSEIKEFAKKNFPDSKSDLFAAYIEKCLELTNKIGSIGMVTPYVWMFIGSYENLRKKIVDYYTFSSLIQLEYNAFAPACIPVCTFIINKQKISKYSGSYIRLSDFKGASNQAPKTLEAINNRNCGWFYSIKSESFKEMPGNPIAYWASSESIKIMSSADAVSLRAVKGLDTNGNIERYLRRWHEVNLGSFSEFTRRKDEAIWFPIAKGGEFRKWYGNHEYVINYENDGFALKENKANLRNRDKYFIEGATWTVISSTGFAVRYLPKGFTFDQGGSGIFLLDNDKYNIWQIISSMNSNITSNIAKMLCPTLNFTTGDVRKFPIWNIQDLMDVAKKLVTLHKKDWNLFETSWEFKSNPMISYDTNLIEESLNKYLIFQDELLNKVIELEKLNDKLIIERCGGCVDEVEVDITQVTLKINARNINKKKDIYQLNDLIVSNSISEMVSYMIGCMMGRYSLDQEGLVYAHAGNQGFDPSLYKTFPADSDGIIPITEEEWFKDDVSNRVVEFVKVVWGEENLTENLQFIADSLCLDAITPRKSETAVETICRYLSTKFYKDHMQTYKKRPVYWLFSSGKEKAFECLVYLHRYNESTLSRMRTEYVTPLLGKYQAYAEQLDKQLDMAESTQDKKRFERELKSMDKKQSELREFDDKLKHFADMRISIDLDDGVKENYGRFGDLLADVKNITGEKPEIINAN